MLIKAATTTLHTLVTSAQKGAASRQSARLAKVSMQSAPSHSDMRGRSSIKLEASQVEMHDSGEEDERDSIASHHLGKVDVAHEFL